MNLQPVMNRWKWVKWKSVNKCFFLLLFYSEQFNNTHWPNTVSFLFVCFFPTFLLFSFLICVFFLSFFLFFSFSCFFFISFIFRLLFSLFSSFYISVFFCRTLVFYVQWPEIHVLSPRMLLISRRRLCLFFVFFYDFSVFFAQHSFACSIFVQLSYPPPPWPWRQ